MTGREETDLQPDRIGTEDVVAPHSDAPTGADAHEGALPPGRDATGGIGGVGDDADVDLADARNSQAADSSPPREAAPGRRVADHAPLFDDSHGERFRTRWHDVQATFVDDPRRAVRDADELVAELIQTVTTTLAERKRSLEGEWQHDDGDADTEDLRLALRGYRSLFDQLLPH